MAVRWIAKMFTGLRLHNPLGSVWFGSVVGFLDIESKLCRMLFFTGIPVFVNVIAEFMPVILLSSVIWNRTHYIALCV